MAPAHQRYPCIGASPRCRQRGLIEREPVRRCRSRAAAEVGTLPFLQPDDVRLQLENPSEGCTGIVGTRLRSTLAVATTVCDDTLPVSHLTSYVGEVPEPTLSDTVCRPAQVTRFG